jgi:glycosyltransferase involved in cell wall biosynthesis
VFLTVYTLSCSTFLLRHCVFTSTQNLSSATALRIVIVSSCPEAWGGSEELWAGTALHLTQAGHSVHVFKANVAVQHRRIVALRAAGCTVTELEQSPPLTKRLLNRLRPYHRQYSRPSLAQRVLRQGLQRLNPQLVLISQGSNYDGISLAEVCRELQLRFVLLAQKAVDFFFPPWYEQTAAVYAAAQRCYFVARHNLELTQYQLGMKLPGAMVVWNPFNVPFNSEMPLPPIGSDGVVKLACVARLEVLDKGLDLLLQVLALPQWRQRPLHVTCFGRGGDQQALAAMARLLGVENQLTFAGQVDDIQQVWQTHHALVLPSRNEGLPLALVEAMLCGRPAIATNAGGVAEILLPNETGFLAEAATVPALAAALEQAWAQRATWPRMGAQAARHARATVPVDAAAQFAQELITQVVAQ